MLIAHVLRDKGAAVHTLTDEASLEHAAKELSSRKVGALVVLDLDGELVGVISERDIVREVARHGAEAMQTKVAAAMTRAVITAGIDESIDDCLARMTDRRIRHLPVVQAGRLAGIVSIGDLVKHRIAAVEAEAAAMQAYITTH
ncbi:MAG: CBS domain-containing protein [Caulobacterales bacterium]|jgi:CBS domain-containing protein|nr:CBS domain-containing protein [Caulobacterales bacterium]